MDSKKEAIQPKNVWNSRVFGFTHAVKKGNILTISGQNGINIKGEVEGKGDFEKQLRLAFENMKNILAEAGMTFDDVLMLRSYLTDIKNLEKFVQIELEYFKIDFPPAHTSVEVPKLALPDLLVEVDAIACDVKPKEYYTNPLLIVVLHMPY